MFTSGRNLPLLMLVGQAGLKEHGTEESGSRKFLLDMEVPFSVITDSI